MTLHNLPPSAILIIGALLVPLLPGKLKTWLTILLPAFAFYWVYQLEEGLVLTTQFMGFEIQYLRVDALSKAFGYIFTLNAFAAFIYAFHLKDSAQHLNALLYIGSSLGVVFAGDLITLYVFWELMAVTSTFLILARKTQKSMGAAFRYILIHGLGGLILLFGIILIAGDTGSILFSSELFSDPTRGAWLILIGLLINAGAPPLGSWLPDSYPEATITGGVILSAYTSKTAVYTLLRGFPGYDILIVIGCIMAIYGIIYALLENDMRRILAYSIINQVGFMVCAAGIGSKTAINGAVAHAFCHIIYKALLWMSAGAVMHALYKKYGKYLSKCTDLGGLYKTMPLTMIFGVIGALAISSVPGTSGFTSKSLIIDAAAEAHLLWPWLILEIASAGVFLHAGIKFPYFVFFNQDTHKLRPNEAPWSMHIAMGLLAFLCIFLGFFPEPLYAILPHQDQITQWKGVLYFDKIVIQSQLLIFSGLVFFLMLSWLKRTDTISLDVDWFYRKGGQAFYNACDKYLNGLNSWAHNFFVAGMSKRTTRFFKRGPRRFFVIIQAPFWKDLPLRERRQKVVHTYRRVMLGSIPIGLTAFWAVIILFILFFL